MLELDEQRAVAGAGGAARPFGRRRPGAPGRRRGAARRTRAARVSTVRPVQVVDDEHEVGVRRRRRRTASRNAMNVLDRASGQRRVARRCPARSPRSAQRRRVIGRRAESVDEVEDRQVGSDPAATSEQVPRITLTARRPGRRATDASNSSSSRVFPMPASPPTSTTRPCCRPTSTRACRSASSWRSAADVRLAGRSPGTVAMLAGAVRHGTRGRTRPTSACGPRTVTFGRWPPDGWTATIVETESQP